MLAGGKGRLLVLAKVRPSSSVSRNHAATLSAFVPKVAVS
jgi:hypothetical protein